MDRKQDPHRKLTLLRTQVNALVFAGVADVPSEISALAKQRKFLQAAATLEQLQDGRFGPLVYAWTVLGQSEPGEEYAWFDLRRDMDALVALAAWSKQEAVADLLAWSLWVVSYTYPAYFHDVERQLGATQRQAVLDFLFSACPALQSRPELEALRDGPEFDHAAMHHLIAYELGQMSVNEEDHRVARQMLAAAAWLGVVTETETTRRRWLSLGLLKRLREEAGLSPDIRRLQEMGRDVDRFVRWLANASDVSGQVSAAWDRFRDFVHLLETVALGDGDEDACRRALGKFPVDDEAADERNAKELRSLRNTTAALWNYYRRWAGARQIAVRMLTERVEWGKETLIHIEVENTGNQPLTNIEATLVLEGEGMLDSPTSLLERVDVRDCNQLVWLAEFLKEGPRSVTCHISIGNDPLVEPLAYEFNFEVADEIPFDEFASTRYVEGPAVTDPERFFGRDAFIKKELLGPLYIGTRRQFHLYGIRRVGKSSILRMLDHKQRTLLQEPRRFEPIIIDLQGRKGVGMAGLVQEWMETCAKSFPEVPLPAEETVESNPLAAFGQYILRLMENTPQPLLLYDEGEGLLEQVKSNPDVFSALRAVVEDTQVPVVFCSSIHLPRYQQRNKGLRWFINSLSGVRVGFIEWAGFQDMVTKPVAGAIRFTDEAIAELWRFTKGHPFLTNVICTRIVEHLTEIRRPLVYRSDVAAHAKGFAAGGEADGYLQDIVDELDGDERRILVLLAQTPGLTMRALAERLPGADVPTILSRLSGLELIRGRPESSWQIHFEFLRIYAGKRLAVRTDSEGSADDEWAGDEGIDGDEGIAGPGEDES